jgi:hypothetical protein
MMPVKAIMMERWRCDHCGAEAHFEQEVAGGFDLFRAGAALEQERQQAGWKKHHACLGEEAFCRNCSEREQELELGELL